MKLFNNITLSFEIMFSFKCLTFDLYVAIKSNNKLQHIIISYNIMNILLAHTFILQNVVCCYFKISYFLL